MQLGTDCMGVLPAALQAGPTHMRSVYQLISVLVCTELVFTSSCSKLSSSLLTALELLLFRSFLLLSCFEPACSLYLAGRISELVSFPVGYFFHYNSLLLSHHKHPAAEILDQVFSPLIWFTSSALFFSSRATV
ncbi:hypothetical protein F511_38315 [Dorcoceras hygrometricum]|uniref:Uncharacterized protein n=1 Tax=Dorcoceras hygrometricum TaxID=472368 RepID=A0A2Z7AMD6_9LAMI|nr:hypothetical protein F511_38315 [Dorcoceras hygrometricum]